MVRLIDQANRKDAVVFNMSAHELSLCATGDSAVGEGGNFSRYIRSASEDPHIPGCNKSQFTGHLDLPEDSSVAGPVAMGDGTLGRASNRYIISVNGASTTNLGSEAAKLWGNAWRVLWNNREPSQATAAMEYGFRSPQQAQSNHNEMVRK